MSSVTSVLSGCIRHTTYSQSQEAKGGVGATSPEAETSALEHGLRTVMVSKLAASSQYNERAGTTHAPYQMSGMLVDIVV